MTPIYARIYKVDEQTRTVTGRAAHEVVDRDGELFDYATSKPNFQAWSAEVFADSGGKSLGNVRSMHGNIAAGKLVDIDFNDTERAIDVTAKIVDPDEWRKCLEGVHTGFSIGGRYAKKWSEVQNGKMVQRYTAVPSEISLVDRPCIPTAKFFQVHKRDGSVVRRQFATQEVASMKMSDALASHLGLNDSIAAIRKVHARGSVRLPPDFLHKYESVADRDDAAMQMVRKAHAAAGARQVSVKDLRKMVARGVLRKAGFPPQSRNGTWDDTLASDGANRNYADNGDTGPVRPSVMARTPPRDMSSSSYISAATNSYKAAADAIKRDLRKPKRFGVDQ